MTPQRFSTANQESTSTGENNTDQGYKNWSKSNYENFVTENININENST